MSRYSTLTLNRPARPASRRLLIYFVAAVTLAAAAGAFPFVWRAYVERTFSPTIVAAEDAPGTRVAVVFGARVYPSGRLSAMLRDRVDTAVDLYKAGTVEKILVSGDNRFEDYNEPGAMRDYAVAQGVAQEDVQPDFGGRRTYDTCYRAREIFGVESAILVTQEFHLPRALFTCSQLGMEVVGVAADRREYAPQSIAWSESRETPATLAALFDVIRRAPPPVMGDPIPIE
jgi:SanA protein